jgi:hypothetical protein
MASSALQLSHGGAPESWPRQPRAGGLPKSRALQAPIRFPSMLTPRIAVALGALLLAFVGVPLDLAGPYPATAASSGTILAPVARQAGWLALEAARPRLLTALDPPAYVTDVAAVPASSTAVIAVTAFSPDGTSFGGDLVALDISSSQVATTVARVDGNESLGAPAWLPGAAGLLFQREDHSQSGLARPGAANLSYPSRIEFAQSDGSGRKTLIADGGSPAPAPDGMHVAFLRTSPDGIALLVRSLATETDETLVAAGQFPDLGYPRYAPDGERIAFMAPTVSTRNNPSLLLSPLFGAPTPAYAHGFLFDVWIINVDGSGSRRLAQVGADDGSVSWSPDGMQLFVYGATGSFLVDALTGDSTPLPHLVGSGGTAWLP